MPTLPISAENATTIAKLHFKAAQAVKSPDILAADPNFVKGYRFTGVYIVFYPMMSPTCSMLPSPNR